MAQVRIDRIQKNIMRARLEEVLKMQQDMDQKITAFAEQTEPEEYRQFWQELKTMNQQSIRKVSHFMVRKCNR